jgi:hypothetical protein
MAKHLFMFFLKTFSVCRQNLLQSEIQHCEAEFITVCHLVPGKPHNRKLSRKGRR